MLFISCQNWKTIVLLLLIEVADTFKGLCLIGSQQIWNLKLYFLKILFEKCTNPVYAIAISVGKKIIITGVKIVPNPKPEKKVSIAVPKATTDTMNISIMKIELKSNLHLKIFLCKT